MKISEEKIRRIVEIFQEHYQGWSGFTDPKFLKDEIDYKRTTIERAKTSLDKRELQSLVERKEYDEFIKRLETIGRDGNLLYLAVPMAGDLNILYQEGLDKGRFCQAMVELLYGSGDSPDRLQKYTDWVKERGLPNKWTFPTYFLFVCHPESDLIIKPGTIKRFLVFMGYSDLYSENPSGNAYGNILKLARDLKAKCERYDPQDMVDIQSLIWRVSADLKERVIPEEKLTEFKSMFQEFAGSYFKTEEGKRHIYAYDQARESGTRNYEEILRLAQTGDDITNSVLLKLLPYADNLANREAGAWTHITPAVMGDIKKWFERAGWARSEDWPKIAEKILEFIQKCEREPSQLDKACEEFRSTRYSKGFQMGMLTPILNALKPDDYYLINVKPLKVINYFTNNRFTTDLRDYSKINEVAHRLVNQVRPYILEYDSPIQRDADLFDVFCHWLVAVKNYNFRTVNYWKISPGKNAWNWNACRDGNFIAMGGDELGDISGLGRQEFNSVRDQIVAEDRKLAAEDRRFTKSNLNQIWDFAHIKEGDRILVNQGTKTILAVGTVIGPYYFVPEIRHGHRLPVVWDDLSRRQVNEGGWKRTIVKLDYNKFNRLLKRNR